MDKTRTPFQLRSGERAAFGLALCLVGAEYGLLGVRASASGPAVHLSHRSKWLRAAVLGANDGIGSMASLVLGVAASGAPGTVRARAASLRGRR